MTPREWIDTEFDGEDVLTADGFDEAIIGMAYSPGRGLHLVYDAGKCIEILMRDGMDEETAQEHFDFNVTGAWVGNGTPVFMTRPWEWYDESAELGVTLEGEEAEGENTGAQSVAAEPQVEGKEEDDPK